MTEIASRFDVWDTELFPRIEEGMSTSSSITQIANGSPVKKLEEGRFPFASFELPPDNSKND